ncbi:MAG: hypothetical protein N3I35_17195 [Clostridia bacterium]|nr:hypothetical protein [Clostridia bacterium]
MGDTKIIHIQCTNCNKSFDSSVYCESTDALKMAIMCDNEVCCPLCGKITTWNKENAEITNEDGREFRGNEIFI